MKVITITIDKSLRREIPAHELFDGRRRQTVYYDKNMQLGDLLSDYLSLQIASGAMRVVGVEGDPLHLDTIPYDNERIRIVPRKGALWIPYLRANEYGEQLPFADIKRLDAAMEQQHQRLKGLHIADARRMLLQTYSG